MRSVPDLLFNISRLNIVLVLESPFRAEVAAGHPLAGDTGKAVTTYVKNKVRVSCPVRNFSQALGIELVNTHFDKIGVMNCSLWPLDAGCYQTSYKPSRNAAVVHLDMIRQGRCPRNNSARLRHQMYLQRGFKNRVTRVLSLNPHTFFVPCGKLAAEFVANCSLPNMKTISNLPHPALSNWSRPKLLSQHAHGFQQFDALLQTL